MLRSHAHERSVLPFGLKHVCLIQAKQKSTRAPVNAAQPLLRCKRYQANQCCPRHMVLTNTHTNCGHRAKHAYRALRPPALTRGTNMSTCFLSAFKPTACQSALTLARPALSTSIWPACICASRTMPASFVETSLRLRPAARGAAEQKSCSNTNARIRRNAKRSPGR